jgi:hypothetical protein
MPDDEETLELEESEPLAELLEELLEELEEEDPLDLDDHHHHLPVSGGVGVTIVDETSSGTPTSVSGGGGSSITDQPVDTSGGTGGEQPMSGETTVTEGVDVTVVEETSNPPTDTVHPTLSAPFDEGPMALGLTVPQPTPPTSVDAQHTRWRLRCPGSLTQSVVSNVGFPLFSPTNVGSCDCEFWLLSVDATGRILDPEGANPPRGVALGRGASVPRYDAVPGAVAVIAACSGRCNGTNCEVVLQVRTPVG